MPKVSEQLHSRPPLERMLLIHEKLQSGGFPNCPSLAAETDLRRSLPDQMFQLSR